MRGIFFAHNNFTLTHLPPTHWAAPCTFLEDGRLLLEKVKIGLNSVFNIIKIKLANNAVPNPLILNELNNCDTAMSAIAYNTSCKKNCNICRIQISPHIVLPITFMLSPKHLFIFPDKKTFST